MRATAPRTRAARAASDARGRAVLLRTVLVVTMVCGSFVALGGTAHAGYTPNVAASGENIVPGGTVTISGSSWTSGATVRITSTCFSTSPVTKLVNSLGRFTKSSIALKTTLTDGQTCTATVCEAPGYTKCKSVTFKITASDDDCDDGERSRQLNQRESDDCDD